MIAAVEEKLAHLPGICEKRRVRRLAVFGSAATGGFDPSRSDLDILVDFALMPPVQHAEAYFGLLEDLQRLFGIEVDLIERGPIRNPYFLQAIRDTQMVLYEAA
ncbi:MAG: hypothetical protein FJW37_07555 [Acidobacteria bacterium]|nr:hypothetical protein [Acidobacteriota bacterium]